MDNGVWLAPSPDDADSRSAEALREHHSDQGNKNERTSNWLFTCVPVPVEDDRVRKVDGLRFATKSK